jgi:hypothetical protein
MTFVSYYGYFPNEKFMADIKTQVEQNNKRTLRASWALSIPPRCARSCD